MATTSVEGVVERVHSNGNGFSLRESWPNRDGGQSHRFWSVFMPNGVPVTVIQDDAVKVSGQLRTAVSKRDARYVDHTVSAARVEVVSESRPRTFEPAPPDDDYPPDDTYTWSSAPIQP